MDTPDPENALDETEVDITDLDSPAETGKVPGRYTRRRQVRSLRERVWMSIAIIAGIVLLIVVVLVSLPHGPGPTKMMKGLPLPTGHPLTLALVDGIAYASSLDGTVMALRVSDGSLLWHHESAIAAEESTTIADGMVFLSPLTFHNASTTVKIDALRASDGSPLWSRAIPFNSSVPPFPIQLTIVDGIVYVSSQTNSLYALRASDGFLLWVYTSRTPFVSAPTVADGVVYACTEDGLIYALRPSDGFPLWTYTLPISASPVPPVVVNGVIYLNLQTGSMDALRASEGTLLWHYVPRVPFAESPPLVEHGVVYVSALDGSIYALRASDGFTLWQAALHMPAILPSMIVIGGVIYVVTQDGRVDALRASDGSVLWRYTGAEGGTASITVAQGVVYLALQAGDITRIVALRASDGFEIWHYTPQVPSTQLSPLVADGIVLIVLQDGSINALRASSGSLLWHHS